mmetsp:Transcript_36113/g.64595  ORF Transcript_36113/g.64595 Transcript_36113/m.64595 type:complete len:257 (-) Transcript_36113:271-1041(-)
MQGAAVLDHRVGGVVPAAVDLIDEVLGKPSLLGQAVMVLLHPVVDVAFPRQEPKDDVGGRRLGLTRVALPALFVGAGPGGLPDYCGGDAGAGVEDCLAGQPQELSQLAALVPQHGRLVLVLGRRQPRWGIMVVARGLGALPRALWGGKGAFVTPAVHELGVLWLKEPCRPQTPTNRGVCLRPLDGGRRGMGLRDGGRGRGRDWGWGWGRGRGRGNLPCISNYYSYHTPVPLNLRSLLFLCATLPLTSILGLKKIDV